jgi:aquaporin Z
MVLVLTGCGSAVLASYCVGNVGVSFAFGLALLAMVCTIGDVSGCHINPVVSVSMLVAGKISVRDTVLYVVFQCVGAVIGSGIL